MLIKNNYVQIWTKGMKKHGKLKQLIYWPGGILGDFSCISSFSLFTVVLLLVQ